METQDSIDIVKLQRVALGLDSAHSQPSSKTSDLVQHSLPDYRELGSPRNLNDPVSLANRQPALHKSPSHRSERFHRSSPQELQHATSLTIDNRRSLEQEDPTRVLLQRPMEMSSAEMVPSDTQVISQSVYDDIIRRNKEAANNEIDNNLADRATLATLYEGDSGHIDLLAGFDSTNINSNNVDDTEDQSSFKLGESSPVNYQPNLFPESQRFIVKTPATVLKQGHVEDPGTGTPSISRNPLASDLGSSGGIMALSQVFKATQAPSSPLVRDQHSDPMSDRPSPNIPVQNRPLATAVSSPLNHLAATFPQDSSEPQLNYVTMKESQAERDRILRERLTRSAEHVYSEDHSDGEFDKEPSFVERMARRRMIDDEAMAQFAGLTAPARSPKRRGRLADKKLECRSIVEQSRVDVKKDAQQEHTSALQTEGTSEEETEQEQEYYSPAPRSQELKPPTEEDKENCSDPSTPLVAATNAHGRLSQVLSLDDSQPQPRGQSRDEQADGIGGSSQILIVKDSQRSPSGNHDQNIEYNNPEQWAQHHARRSNSQIRPPFDLTNITSSPTKQIRIQSSPPSASQRSRVSFHLGDRAARGRSNSSSSHSSSDHLTRNSSVPDGSITQHSHLIDSNCAEGYDKTAKSDPRAKSSSMPSLVAETPVQRPRIVADELPVTSIPETSPNRFQNELMDQEDDDLPPLHQIVHERASHSQPVNSNISTPVKPFRTSKILSSPSGRQRRALTEIASDASPQVGLGSFDMDINVLTADDQEFRSAVAMSPIPPRKKRRGNDGQNICASDPVLPITPRPISYLSRFQQNERADVEETQSSESMAAPECVFEKRSNPSRRIDTFWEVDESPQVYIPRKERLGLLNRSRSIGKKPENSQPPMNSSDVQPEVGHDHQRATSDPVEQPNEDAHGKSGDNVPKESDRISTPSVENVPIAVNQVFAPWSGAKRAYYPATCFGKPFGTSNTRYLVKFEDAAPIEVPMSAVKRLELRIGDAVKVDVPNVPKVTHIIRGFSDKLSADDLSREVSSGTMRMIDIYGHATVILGPKQRKSLPSGTLTGPESVVRVPISRVYLDTILWNQLKDRTYTYSSGLGHTESRLQTPSDRHLTPMSPSTRLSRSIRYSNGVFSGMVFAVSYGDNNGTKSRIMRMILDNGGHILNDGFNELFDLPSNAPLATTSKSPAPIVNERQSLLRLTRGAEDIGFACLIADRHSRRPKYMQALALNLPCLSDRWIEDCVAQGKVVDWDMYLLPAGESSYLNGATKSRTLTSYPALMARFPDTIAARPNLLDGQSVLIVMGRSKADEERRRAYLFLTYALGASRVERIPDLKSARAVLDQQGEASNKCEWDWIYVDNDEKASAIATILGSTMARSHKAQSSQKSKKRKRSELTESISDSDLGLGTHVRIVGNEFVCQSLILGKLFDQ
ncbi:hypothetical protein EYZ11_007842 [Aspergillus tanneri]|uniref:BRCT domain-containing protein n=1 Tax=Aspergillus tanneri TaxID=1220188 RepID=A0A4S3JHJ0_9EURO|nr:uncharacterized protein ATNIH1004_006274 [Aspergillus tanneri]KAA8647580.1 hypothetical protein ATNIH1004_006274 [Aspergillus tanneri]THC92671.1 hypothetical protein EYZ11_007842 [Aspergillus tanneri]